MLKDLLQSLQQGAAMSKARLAESQSVLSDAAASANYASSMEMPAPVGQAESGRKGGRVTSQSMPAGKLGAFLKAIAEQESGGNYNAVNSGSGAMGKYQIMPSNIQGSGGWDQEILGRNISTQAFLNNPRLQERIARGKLTNYFRQFGAGGAAKAWYAGPDDAYTNSNASQYGGPSINDYAAQVLAKMKRYM